MTNKQKYNNVFIDTFSIDESALGDEFKYQSIPLWDSIGHMAMVASLEEAFDVVLEMDDIIDFSSYNKGSSLSLTILTKYNIHFKGPEKVSRL